MTPLPTPKRLLVVPLRYIGDTILTIPLLRNLRHYFPEVHLDVLVSKTAEPLLRDCPYINGLIIEPEQSKERIPAIKRGGYDTAIILRKSFTMAYYCKRARIKTLIGYDKQRFMKPIFFKRWGLLLDYKTPYPSRTTHVPQVMSHLGHLKAYGLEPKDDYLELWASHSDNEQVKQLLEDQGVTSQKPMAIIHSTSASSGKSLSVSHFASAIKHLYDAGYQIVCTGLNADYPLYETLSKTNQIPLCNLAGKTTLMETFALYTQAHLMLSVDSGPIHMAAAASIPKIIGVYMTTNEKQWGPHSAKSQFFPALIPPEIPLDSSESEKKIQEKIQSAIMEATTADCLTK